jgi:Zn-dependent M28 family amino/carboxypeptidase
MWLCRAVIPCAAQHVSGIPPTALHNEIGFYLDTDGARLGPAATQGGAQNIVAFGLTCAGFCAGCLINLATCGKTFSWTVLPAVPPEFHEVEQAERHCQSVLGASTGDQEEACC